MMKWLQKIFSTPPPKVPLRGRPAIRREKSYAAETGYVYQYFYEGFREADMDGEDGQEHLFSISSDRVAQFPIRIFLSRKVTTEWQVTKQRELNATEQYALIKMALFAMFDRQPTLAGGVPPIYITYKEADEYAATLSLT